MPRSQSPKLRLPLSSQYVARGGTVLVLLVLGIIAVLLVIGSVRMTWTQHQINQARAEQARINDEQRASNAELKGQAEYRESDVYAEQAAREQLGMARDGETVLLPTVVIPATTAPAPSGTAVPAGQSDAVVAELESSAIPNYERWWRAFFPEPATTP